MKLSILFLSGLFMVSTCNKKTITISGELSTAAQGRKLVKFQWSGQPVYSNMDSITATCLPQQGDTAVLTVWDDLGNSATGKVFFK